MLAPGHGCWYFCGSVLPIVWLMVWLSTSTDRQVNEPALVEGSHISAGLNVAVDPLYILEYAVVSDRCPMQVYARNRQAMH